MAKKEKPITVEQYRKLVHEGKLVDPLIFMESLVSGVDIRDNAMIYDLVEEIDMTTDGQPDEDDWREVVQMVRRHYKFERVKISASQRAAERLSEYIHAKVKTIEKDESKTNEGDTLLTEEEIILFREKFNDEY